MGYILGLPFNENRHVGRETSLHHFDGVLRYISDTVAAAVFGMWGVTLLVLEPHTEDARLGMLRLQRSRRMRKAEDHLKKRLNPHVFGKTAYELQSRFLASPRGTDPIQGCFGKPIIEPPFRILCPPQHVPSTHKIACGSHVLGKAAYMKTPSVDETHKSGPNSQIQLPAPVKYIR